MPRPKTRPRAGRRAADDRAAENQAPGPRHVTEWPEVLTLAEAAAYLRVPESEVVRMVGPRGLPGRLIGSDWRFSRMALNEWLGTPPAASSREALVALSGAWKDDPDAHAMLEEIYRR